MKLIEGLAGERAIYKRRGEKDPEVRPSRLLTCGKFTWGVDLLIWPRGSFCQGPNPTSRPDPTHLTTPPVPRVLSVSTPKPLKGLSSVSCSSFTSHVKEKFQNPLQWASKRRALLMMLSLRTETHRTHTVRVLPFSLSWGVRSRSPST